MASAARHTRVLHVSLQGVEGWQGGATHSAAIRQGLVERGFHVGEVSPVGSTNAWGRLVAMGGAILRAAFLIPHYDVIYMRHHPLGAPLALVARARGVCRIEEVNGVISDYAVVYRLLRPLTWMLQALSTGQLNSADRVVAVSDAMAESIRRSTAADPVVIPNGADLDLFRPATDDDDRPMPAPYVLFFGALAPWQGVSDLLAARADAHWPDEVALVLIGDGVLRSDVAAHHCPPQIRYLGPMPQRELASWVRHAMATVSSKNNAAAMASPLKVMESVASGIPVIATDIGQQSELLKKTGTGIAVAVGDPAGIAGAVAAVYNDASFRHGLSDACQRTRRQMGWSPRLDTLESLIAQLVA